MEDEDTQSGSHSVNGGASNPQLQPVTGATPATFAVATPSNGTSSTSSSTMPSFPALSATTAELLARARANATGNGTPGYEAAREQLMKSMMMSDKLPIPVAAAAPKRGRGGRRSRGGADGRSPSESTPGSTATPTSERGRAKVGRPRGRGRGGGGRGGKRKRSESVDSDAWNDPTSDSDADHKQKDDDDASDVSASYTPLPKVTKSGRSINKPTQYVPVIPEPASQPNKKKRPYRRNIEAAVCKMCHRPTSPTNNQIVFCDGCGTPYHQYCHDPPIENEVVEVQEKEWFCSECTKSRSSPEKGDAEGLISGESLTVEEKRSRLTSLPPSRLIDLLLRASSLQPTLPLFPASAAAATSSQTNTTTVAPAPPTFNHNEPITIDVTGDAGDDISGENEPYDGYDTDPPAHYPKPGNGLARTLRPEAEDLEWLVDENDDVFSHQVRPLGLGLGLNGGSGDGE